MGESSISPCTTQPKLADMYIYQWISGAGDPRNKVHIVLAVTDPSNPSPHKRHSLILVPSNNSGLKIIRPMTVFGYDDAPEGHCEVVYDNATVGVEEGIVGGKAGLGRGFEIIQARLGPGRLHHCMRSIGVAERALELLLLRVTDSVRKTFGKSLSEHGEYCRYGDVSFWTWKLGTRADRSKERSSRILPIVEPRLISLDYSCWPLLVRWTSTAPRLLFRRLACRR